MGRRMSVIHDKEINNAKLDLKKTGYKKYGMRRAKNKLKGWIQDNPNHTLQGLALKCTADFALKISKSSIHRVLYVAPGFSPHHQKLVF